GRHTRHADRRSGIGHFVRRLERRLHGRDDGLHDHAARQPNRHGADVDPERPRVVGRRGRRRRWRWGWRGVPPSRPAPVPPAFQNPLAPSAVRYVSDTARNVWITSAAPAAGPRATNYVIEAGSAPGLDNLAVVRTADAGLLFFAPNVPPGLYY